MGGLVERNAFPFPRCVLTDVGSEKGNKKDADASKLTLSREIDPYFCDANGVPLLDGRWTSGSLWAQDIVSGLTFTSTAPMATATAATTANIVFAAPIGGTSPYTYTVQKSSSALMTSPSTASQGTVTVNSGVVTIPLTGLTTATTSYFQVTVTDNVGATAKSQVTNACLQP